MEQNLINEFEKSLEWGKTKKIDRVQALKIYKMLLNINPKACLYNYGQNSFGFILNNKRYEFDGNYVIIKGA